MTGNLRVGYEALDFAASDIRQAALDIEDQLTALEQRMMGRQADWTGAASEAFTEARLKWDGAMNDMKDILQDVGVQVGLSNEEYQRAEAANARRFQAHT